MFPTMCDRRLAAARGSSAALNTCSPVRASRRRRDWAGRDRVAHHVSHTGRRHKNAAVRFVWIQIAALCSHPAHIVAARILVAVVSLPPTFQRRHDPSSTSHDSMVACRCSTQLLIDLNNDYDFHIPDRSMYGDVLVLDGRSTATLYVHCTSSARRPENAIDVTPVEQARTKSC